MEKKISTATVKEAGTATQQIDCLIYKGHKRDGTYLYVADQHKLNELPAALLQVLGRLELVMELRLNLHRRLARADVVEVMKGIRNNGYYLQLPPPDLMVTNSTH